MSGNVQLHPEWLRVLESEFEQPYMIALKRFLLERKAAGAEIYPPGGLIFNAEGRRFCNELGRQDYATYMPPFRLVLNKAASRVIISHCTWSSTT